jgi:hypothetical protein
LFEFGDVVTSATSSLFPRAMVLAAIEQPFSYDEFQIGENQRVDFRTDHLMVIYLEAHPDDDAFPAGTVDAWMAKDCKKEDA